jgi:hypothetical protein
VEPALPEGMTLDGATGDADGSYESGQQALLEPSVDGEVASYTVEPALPEGMTLDGATGEADGSYESVQQTLLEPSFDGEVASFTVEPALPEGMTLNGATGEADGSYESGQQVLLEPTADDEVASYTVEPALLEGMPFDGATGDIRGAPTVTCPGTADVITATTEFEPSNPQCAGQPPKNDTHPAVESRPAPPKPAEAPKSTEPAAISFEVKVPPPKAYVSTASNPSKSASGTLHPQVTPPPPTRRKYPGLKEKVNYAFRGASSLRCAQTSSRGVHVFERPSNDVSFKSLRASPQTWKGR